MSKASGGGTTSGGSYASLGTGEDTNRRSRGSRGSNGQASRVAAGGAGEGYLCTFSVAGQRYALSTSLVRELVEVTRVTTVPCVDPALLGIFNLRGEPMPLVDLSRVLGLPAEGLSEKMAVIIIRGEAMSLGARIDALGAVVPNSSVIATADANPLVRGFLAATSSEGPIAVINPGEFMMRLEQLKSRTQESSKGVSA